MQYEPRDIHIPIPVLRKPHDQFMFLWNALYLNFHVMVFNILIYIPLIYVINCLLNDSW